MKKFALFSLGIVLVLISLYFILAKDKSAEMNAVETKKESPYMANYLKSGWLNTLPAYAWGEIEKSDETYSYAYKEAVEGDSRINKSVQYKKNQKGEFQGMMQIDFSGKADSYVVDIPKAFASHVDKLNFSQEPSKIINPDPIVEFTNTTTGVEINSSETKSSQEIKESLEEQIINTEWKKCEGLKSNEALACSLSLVAKYRESKVMEKELSSLDLKNVVGASAQAVLKKNMSYCSKFISDREDKTFCYEVVYQILVRECHTFDDKEYRTCVRKTTDELPSFQERRLFCGHIDDENMRAECQGVTKIEVCDEIEDDEEKSLCKINIARTSRNIESCDGIENPDYKQACIAIIGIEKDDESYCNKIKDEYIQGQCKAKIAIQKNDRKICEQITDEDSKNICYGHFIMNKQDVSQTMCDSINELWIKEMCEMALAINNKDVDKCKSANIINTDNQAICLMAIALKYKNPDYCKEIVIIKGEENEEAKQKIKDQCSSVASASSAASDTLAEETKEKQVIDDTPVIPAFPDWFDCPIPETAKLFTTSNEMGSVMKYIDPNDVNKVTGPTVGYREPNFNDPFQFFCYNKDGEKHGPFKAYQEKTGLIDKEGYYKNDKYDQIVTTYINGVIRSKVTYENGLSNGPAEDYCTNDACGKGTLSAKGPNVDGKKQGIWQFYENGSPSYKKNYNQGRAGPKIVN